MLEIRWHSRAGQGAITGGKGLADVLATTGKEVQAYAEYGSAKRGAAMRVYDRIADEPILNREKFMNPDYVLVIDPELTFITNICLFEKPTTKYIITTPFSKEELLIKREDLKTREVYVLDCIKIAKETIGRNIPSTPMLGAFMKVSGLLELEFFQESFKRVLGKKHSQAVIDSNMKAIARAYEEVN